MICSAECRFLAMISCLPNVSILRDYSHKEWTGYWGAGQIPELGQSAGIHKRVHAHGLRHTHASELRVEGVDIAVIRRQLGHASLLTTVEYLDHLSANLVVETVVARGIASLT